MDEKIKKFCPNCCQLYTINFSSSSKLKANLPLFLPCGHSMCENCIQNIAKCMEPIECKICQRDANLTPNLATEITQSPTKLYKTFPVNYQMVGELVMHSSMISETDKKGEDECFIDLKALLKSAPAQGHCSECHTPTHKMCKQCAMIVCDSCFNKSHKNFVVFKSHVLQNIETLSLSNECKIHIGKPLDYYCKDCNKAICIDCMVVGGSDKTFCKNHEIVSLQEINANFLEELNDISPKVDETFRRLTKTAVDIGNLLVNYENDTGSAKELTDIIANVEQHFSKLCSIIQKHKDEITNIILYLKHSEKDSLQKAKSDVANAMKKAKNIIKTIQDTTSNSSKINEVNLPALLEEAKQIVDAPWYLNKTEKNTEFLKVNVNEDLCSLVSDYIHLEGNVKSLYKLSSTSELGDDAEIPPPPTAPVYPPELPKDARKSNKPTKQKENEKAREVNNKDLPKTPALYKNAPKYRSKSGSVSSLNSNSSETSYKSYLTQNDNYVNYYQPVQPVSPFTEIQHPRQLREGSQDLIYICHIVDPHNFFAQRACHQGLVKDMVREFRNAVSFAKPSINHIMEGKTYLAFNKADNMWQRCRVININKTNKDQPLVQVFCFDFGSTETVTVDKLRLLPPAKIQSPSPLALHCSLANCIPKTGSWTSDDSFLIQNIIDNKQAVIHVRRIFSVSNVDFKIDCDITTFENGVSLAHALVFHDRAKMPNPKLSYPPTMGIKEKPKLHMSHSVFKPNVSESVYITHIVSPDVFYIRKQDEQEIYNKLSEDLEQEYSTSSNVGSVYLPENGMVCAVNIEKYRQTNEDRSWARGVVKELPGRGRVRVLLPDSGLTLLVHWTALRYIHHKFTVLQALATECHLAGITPLNKKWSANSVALLQKYQGTLLELQVEGPRHRTNRTHGSVGVTLYDNSDPENTVCINSEMIKYKFAISFGQYMFYKSPVEEQVVTNKYPLAKPPAPKPKTDQITIMKRNAPPKVNEEDLVAKDKGPLRLEAKILNYQSPSLIYLSLVHQQKTFNELFENIQKYYSKPNNNSLPQTEWKVGDKCCTMCIQSQTWRRAVILELVDDKAKVFYSDFACIETVPKDSLRELPADFMFGDAAIKCHLCGIMPAVGKEWPSLTKEYLKELLDAYNRVFITKLGVFKDKSMPIEIWVYHTIQGEALEPNKSEWRCLNKKIIEQGLGIPDKSEVVIEETTENEDDEKLSFLNITGSVNDWLQLEPAPLMQVAKHDANSKTNSPLLEEFENMNVSSPDEPGSSNIVYISDWLKPEPLSRKEFTGIPTFIDNTGIIYLHDVLQQDTLDLIRKALDVRFKLPDPKAKFYRWTVGEPCVALFFLDNRYYRGRVIEVNKESSACLIQYVDYGNEEWCTFENMRKSVPLHQIPIQAHKCMLNRIRPVGNVWDRQTLDYIHKSIVEKKCYVKVEGEPVDGILPIELKYDKLLINDHLVDFEMAEYTDGSKSVVKKFGSTKSKKHVYVAEEVTAVESDSGPDYIVVEDEDTVEESTASRDSFDFNSMKEKDWNQLIEEENKNTKFITYPKYDEEEFTCNISVINNINMLELSVVMDDETGRIYEQMFEDLQAECASMPPLTGIYENKACLAIFPEDGQWYRASILQYSEAKKRVKVKYIDYGNIDVISLVDTREINEEWAQLPPATVSAKLYGVKLNPDVDINVVTKEYTQTFLDGGPFHAKVVVQDEAVPLVVLRNENNELVYNKLIEDKIFLQNE